MNLKDFISAALYKPSDCIAYYVSRKLAEGYSDKSIIEGETYLFDPAAFARAGHCTLVQETAVHNHFVTQWRGPDKKLRREAENAWVNVLWQGHLLDVLMLTWMDDGCKTRHFWVIAETECVADEFFRAVCGWCAEVRSEVLIFEGGEWQKSEELYAAIKTATFDNLILREALKQEIRGDFEHFFAAREMYERYSIPWKRGVLFIGPPGNGKTHTVKALINELKQPCLYVKSFKAHYSTDHENMRRVFQRARQTVPCLLVLEDVDSLVDEDNRSFFLNELDGFAANTGVVIVATTNHPERLDIAILDRPSRFDRKYYFELPAPIERAAYVAAWNATLQTELRLSAAAFNDVVALTEGFSFAYLKELFLSSLMQWVATAQAGGMDWLIVERARILREQMRTVPPKELTVAAGKR